MSKLSKALEYQRRLKGVEKKDREESRKKEQSKIKENETIISITTDKEKEVGEATMICGF